MGADFYSLVIIGEEITKEFKKKEITKYNENDGKPYKSFIEESYWVFASDETLVEKLNKDISNYFDNEDEEFDPTEPDDGELGVQSNDLYYNSDGYDERNHYYYGYKVYEAGLLDNPIQILNAELEDAKKKYGLATNRKANIYLLCKGY